MNGNSPYGWPTGNIQRPQSVDHGHWSSGPPTPYPQFAQKLPTVTAPHLHPIPGTPSWVLTPLPSHFPLPAPHYHYQTSPPEVNELPPLTPDSNSGEDGNLPVVVSNPTPWGLPPYGYSASPFPVMPVMGHRHHHQHPSMRVPLYSARLRASSESTIPILHIPRWRIKGRPSHWRSGYKPSASTRVKICFSKPICASSVHTLHELISYKFPRQFPLQLDLRHPYTMTLFHNPERYSNIVDLHQLATSPPTHEMQLYHPLLPWHVDIRASTPSGITIGDILQQLCNSLRTQIEETDYSNDVLTWDEKHQIVDTYCLRNGGLPRSLAEGICRVDFLGPDVLFRGLTKTREGWLIKTTSLY
ncbi:uncharacterized protein C8R40DRAFT_1096415 [Lentinula edodes]|uniref:uncharacterized protein n=1 Tax=Lentinula edodes TaxID=5353 RepID=UPI001E8DE618|nr:uncharacterized protein C8R40DRAFT_1096415 [Lentinula edodes]KAH7876914.1 hypothetical protein C8R40DRAFT_1096415 [Lentinula edodes]